MQRNFLQTKAVKKSVASESATAIVLEPTVKKKNADGALKTYLETQWALSPEETFGVLPAFVAFCPRS